MLYVERFRTSYERREYEKRNCIVRGTEKQKVDRKIVWRDFQKEFSLPEELKY